MLLGPASGCAMHSLRALEKRLTLQDRAFSVTASRVLLSSSSTGGHPHSPTEAAAAWIASAAAVSSAETEFSLGALTRPTRPMNIDHSKCDE